MNKKLIPLWLGLIPLVAACGDAQALLHGAKPNTTPPARTTTATPTPTTTAAAGAELPPLTEEALREKLELAIETGITCDALINTTSSALQTDHKLAPELAEPYAEFLIQNYSEGCGESVETERNAEDEAAPDEGEEPETGLVENERLSTFITDEVNVRVQPSARSRSIYIGQAGEEIEITAREQGRDGYLWCEVGVGEIVGWVRGDLIEGCMDTPPENTRSLDRPTN